MISTIRKAAWRILGAPPSHLLPTPPQVVHSESLIEKIAWFCACEKIEGDYLEFGLYRGRSFVGAYHALEKAFQKRAAQVEGGASENDARERRDIWEKTRFLGFDSFEGLPKLEGVDVEGEDFAPGQYACGEEDFRKILKKRGIPADRYELVPGWFKDSCTPQTANRLNIQKASIIWIDGDLYASAKDCLTFVTPFLQDGTVIVFDDWFAFRGHPQKGEQLAFEEWRHDLTDYRFSEFHSEGVWRKSFICSKI